MVWSTGQGNYTRVCADGTSPRISFALPPFGTCLYIALFCSQDDSHNLHVSEAGLRLSETPAVRRVIEKHMPFMLEVVAESRHFFLRAETRWVGGHGWLDCANGLLVRAVTVRAVC